MKALTTLKSSIDKGSHFGILALISLLPVLVPAHALAAELKTSGTQNQVFEIKVENPNLEVLTPKLNNNQNILTIDTLAENDPLVIKLKQYLADNNSPLGEYAPEMVKLPQWQRALAISYVESHMGKYCANNNCSGIGGAPGTPTWRKYATKLDWFTDLTDLLEKPMYKEKFDTFKKMRGVYVQPGSLAWVSGAQRKYDELMELSLNAEIERQGLALQQSQIASTIGTFSEVAN